MKKEYEIAAYYFPNYHPDSWNSVWHGTGWTEWELVKRAEPRFEGHRQPRIPVWGYEDESDPRVMEKKIEMAASHGLSAFIFDWYWYNEGPFLQRCLENGFLKAINNEKLKFALMWANHDWNDMHPAKRSPYNALMLSGKITEETFIRATDHMISNYFIKPNYWRVNGGIYFSFYELMSLVNSFNGLDETRRILNEFRQRVRVAGLGDLHLNAVVWGIQILPSEKKITDPNEMLRYLGFDSVTSYVWVHHVELNSFPKTDYRYVVEKSVKDFERFTKDFELPYYPNVTVGWDPSPRTVQSDLYENTGYPFTATLEGNTPEEFEKALYDAKEFLDRGMTNPKILTINAWNEWTEGSYLEPDSVYGMAYLEAIKKVFGQSEGMLSV